MHYAGYARSPPSLNGRVRDTPIIGCGFYAGPKGAVAATGIGEYIVREMLARTVYVWIEGGESLESALQRGVKLFASGIDVGLIGVTETEAAGASNRDMRMPLLPTRGRRFNNDSEAPTTASGAAIAQQALYRRN